MEGSREKEGCKTRAPLDSTRCPLAPSPFDSSLFSSSIAVSRDATEDEIKKAYRTLAQTCHPDKHSSPVLREVRAMRVTKEKCAHLSLLMGTAPILVPYCTVEEMTSKKNILK